MVVAECGWHEHPGCGLGFQGPSFVPPPEKPDDHAFGRSHGGPWKFGSKLHLLTCGRGIVLVATLTAGQAHESLPLDPLPPPSFDAKLHKRRNMVEPTVGPLKRYRLPATPQEKLAVNFMAFVQLVVGLQLLKIVFLDHA